MYIYMYIYIYMTRTRRVNLPLRFLCAIESGCSDL